MPEPNTDFCQFDCGETVVVSFVIASCYSAQAFDFVADFTHQIASLVKTFAKGWLDPQIQRQHAEKILLKNPMVFKGDYRGTAYCRVSFSQSLKCAT